MKRISCLIWASLFILPVTGLSQAKKGGKRMPEISLPGPLGTEVPLSNLKGKVVLVDFWASWCKPCRLNNPNLVELHDKFKEQGFEIYGVSIDEDKSAWMSAITDDKMFWTHVVDTRGGQSTVLTSLNVSFIPSNFLVDKKGVIRGYDVQKEDLEKMIPELVKE